jgi:CheY-like chemotaxis protein
MRPRQALILAIEDEPRNVALLRGIFGRTGHALHVVESLADGRTWLASETPDMILLDRHLPDGDGLDLLREIRAVPRLAERPVLVVSASVLPADREAALAAGATGFVPKPVGVRSLLDEVERNLPPT